MLGVALGLGFLVITIPAWIFVIVAIAKSLATVTFEAADKNKWWGFPAYMAVSVPLVIGGIIGLAGIMMTGARIMGAL